MAALLAEEGYVALAAAADDARAALHLVAGDAARLGKIAAICHADACDPATGGANCTGSCLCVETVLCVKGSTFDSSPKVCACVPASPPPPAGTRRCTRSRSFERAVPAFGPRRSETGLLLQRARQVRPVRQAYRPGSAASPPAPAAHQSNPTLGDARRRLSPGTLRLKPPRSRSQRPAAARRCRSAGRRHRRG
jgi:hypothetical protein